MTVTTTPYNPFDYLDSQEEVEAYLSAAFLDEDPRMFLVALGYLAKKRGMAEVARLAGVNRESLYKSFFGDGNPGYVTIVKVVWALKIRMIPDVTAMA